MSSPAPSPLHKRIKAKPSLHNAEALRERKTVLNSEVTQDALLDSAIVYVDAESYADFLTKLDTPSAPNERLKKTMQSKPPWE